ncbi:hypothetical protein N619_06785 [Ectopseudomonas oleovorans]|nr:hypothetical protein N619_06785 [Pseudomonas oleovorans]
MALAAIKAVRNSEPLFADMQKDLLVQLYELKSGKGSAAAESLLEKINRYITIKPNIMGFGADFNAMIDDFIRRKK